MAASSSSTTYEVFLSFRGVDTRYGFTSHLHAALVKEKIETFIDEDLNQGDEISPSLLTTVEKSMISVIIFSERYADSRWCLDELVQIFKCKEKYGLYVIPIFCHVEPTDVRNQTGTFGDGFAVLQKRFKDKPEMLDRWSTTLSRAAELSGFDSNVIKRESDLVKEIVHRIVEILSSLSSSYNKNLVGVESSIEEIESLLKKESEKNLCIVGIWGMGGIGKTAIARAVFDKIKNQFDLGYFASNVWEESKKPNGLNSLLDKLCERLNIPKDETRLPFVRKKLGRSKVLIVLDNVTSTREIKCLIGDFINHFGLGSRIIMTTRDRHVLRSYKVWIKNIEVYEVKGLSHEEALELFSWHAFGQNCPKSDYLTLSKMVVEYAKGVPLALIVLGEFLCEMTKEDWDSAIEKLKVIPNQKVQDVLKLSYDELDDIKKNIFLDIACFLRSENEDLVIKFLNAGGFKAKMEIKVLIDKCLITRSNNKITMNDLLQIMGWEIVRDESPKYPEKRSRLWFHEDICKVLRKNTGTERIEGICLDMSKIRDTDLRPHPFAKMNKLQLFTKMNELRLFKLYNSRCEKNNIIKKNDFDGLESDELSYLCWHGCPLNSLKSKFHTENLVALIMPHSHVEQLWIGDQHFKNLIHINLSHSKQLVKITVLSVAAYLETLILEGCTKLLEISSCIERLNKLTYLGLGYCERLQSLPELPCSLESVDAHCCDSLEPSSGLSTTNLRSGRFNFSNCFKLDQNALKDIIKDVLQNIEQPNVSPCEIRASICFPGTEIPEWFNLRSPGSSIFLKQPPGLFDRHLFALCAMVDFRNYRNEDQGLEVGCNFKYCTDIFYYGTLRGWNIGTGPRDVKSDHIFMGYDILSHDAIKYYYDKMTIEFFVKDLNGDLIDTCEVRECGFYGFLS